MLFVSLTNIHQWLQKCRHF